LTRIAWATASMHARIGASSLVGVVVAGITRSFSGVSVCKED
jgi:hypothetical protein